MKPNQLIKEFVQDIKSKIFDYQELFGVTNSQVIEGINQVKNEIERSM